MGKLRERLRRFDLLAAGIGDNDQARKVFLFNLLVAVITIGTLLYIFIAFLAQPASAFQRLIYILPILILNLMIWGLLSRRNLKLAAFILPAGLFLITGFFAYYGGGVNSLGFIGMIVVPVIASLLTDFRSSLGFLGLTLLAGILLWAAERLGNLPEPIVTRTITLDLFTYSLITIMVTLSTSLILKNLRDEVSERRRSEKALRESVEMSRRTMEELQAANQAQERLQQALQESEGRYRSLFEDNQSVMLLIDPQTFEIVDGNSAACVYYGYSKERLVSRRFIDITVGLDPELGHSLLDLERLKTQQYYQFQQCLATGEIREVETYMGPITVNGRGLVYALIHDITERVAAEAQINRQLRSLAALHAIDRALTTFTELDKILDTVLHHIVSQLGVHAADILLYQASSQSLVFGAERGFRSTTLAKQVLAVQNSYCGRIVFDRNLLYVPNINLIAAEGERQPSFWKVEEFASYFAIPLIARGKVEGVLELYHRTILEPDESWFHLLEMLAGQTAVAIDNAALLADLQHSNLKLTEAYDTTLEGWARALELRDKETEGHSRRVTSLTQQLAYAVGIPVDELVHVRRGALLHDIGKMAIPDSILLKPNSLSREEWTVMYQHPTYAYRLLEQIHFLRPALDIPYCHHEHWDGSGYPRSLKGEEIPLAARVFTVVDVWDALSSNRPYRPAWPRHLVIEYIRQQSGILFDPWVVKIFLAMVESGEEDLLIDQE